MNGKEIVNKTIEIAAIEADISMEQAQKCVKAALVHIQEMTLRHGCLDLSSIGLSVSSRSIK